ncbi:MAG TPA: TonB-dependent receptor [Pyrinomonadaceae bacterium]
MPTVLAAVLCLALSSFAQESRGTLTGRVSDQTGAAIPNATVIVKSQQTNIETTVTTGDEGNYTVTPLQPGRYTVSIEAPGFKRAVSDVVELFTATTSTFDVNLEVGAVGETVTVNADAPLLEADTASRGQVIESTRISELPLVGRNPINLATLAPGVTFNGNPQFNRPFDNGDNVNFSINGGLNRHNDFQLDGVPNNSITDANASRTVSSNNIAFIPSAEATEEFKIQTNSYDAQFGRTGGGTINVSVKSGGSDYHGSIYEFARRYQLNANSFSNNARGLQTTGPCAGQEASPRFTRDQITCENLGGSKIDQYGFVFSGPLRIPRFGEGGDHFYNGKDRTFFLFNAEKYRELSPGQGFSTVPTLLERRGDFSQSGVTIYDPLTTRPDPNNPGQFIRDPFPGNVIPANRINLVGQNIVNGFSLPNTGTANQRFNNFYLSEGLGTDDFHSYVARVDHAFSDNQRMFVRFVNNRRDQFAFGGNNRVGLGIDTQGPLVRENYGVVIDSTTTISPTSILNVRLGFSRFLQAAFREASSPFDATSLGFTPAFSNARPISIVPRITFNDPAGGIPEFGSRNPNSNITNTWSLPVYLTKIMGKHTFKLGGEYRHFQINQAGGSFNFGGGAFCFTNFFTSRIAGNRSSGGAAFADLLLGAPSANSTFAGCNGNAPVTQLENVSPTTFQWGYYAGYIQDDFKVTPRLTLNLGLRYDYEQPPVERYNRQNRGFGFGQASPLAAAVRNASATDCPSCANLNGGLLFTDVGGQPRGAFEPDRNNFQPRIGVAYQLGEKTVLRGGYGLYYFPSAEYGGATGFSVISSYSGTLPGGGANQFIPRADALSNPFPSGLAQPTGSAAGLATQLGGSINFTNPERRIPHIHQYSAGFQHELPFRTKLDISYVGSRSRDILTGDAQGGGARNLNVLSAAQLARARQDPTYLTASVPNPFAGLIPGNATLNAPTIARQNLLVPFPQFGNPNTNGQGVFIFGENVGRLDYNSLQASLEKRLSRGLVGVVSYTFSKNIGALNFLNDQDTEPARAVVDFDTPHVLVVSAVYQLPFGRGQRFFGSAGRAANLILGGFEYSMIGTYRSGRPINLPGNADLIADPRISDPAFSNQNVPGTTATYFNNCVRRLNGTTTQFITNANGQRVQQACTNPAFAERNTSNTLRTSPLRLGNLREPTATTFDMALNKTFAFTERFRLQLRLEAFNVFNTPLFGSPDTSATSNTFGVLNPNNGQRNIARQVQLGFKFNF